MVQSSLLKDSTLPDRKSTRLNSSHTVIYTLSLHDALPIWQFIDLHSLTQLAVPDTRLMVTKYGPIILAERLHFTRSEEHTSELQSHSDLHSFPTRRSSDLAVYRFTFLNTTCCA